MANEHSIARTKEEATALGLKWYFTGVPCKHGHVADRLVSTAHCRECGKRDCRKWYSENKEYHKLCRDNPRRRRGIKQTHGESYTRLYRIWDHMRRRPKHSNKCYAGVTVSDQWATYEPFAAWAKANGYSDDLIIDRIDGTRGYEPANCRWVTYTISNRNRSNVRLTMETVRDIRARRAAGVPLRELAAAFGLTQGQVSAICSGHRWREE